MLQDESTAICVMSAHSFLRIAHSLWAILVSIFEVFISNYFDYFVAIATASETQSVTAAVTSTFKMLGWIFAETGNRAPPFSEAVTAVDVMVDVSSLHKGLVTVANTETKKLEIAAFLTQVLDSGVLLRHECLEAEREIAVCGGPDFWPDSKKMLGSCNEACVWRTWTRDFM